MLPKRLSPLALTFPPSPSPLLLRSALIRPTSPPRRLLGTTPSRRFASSTTTTTTTTSSSGHDNHHHHESQYDPPGGWLWGERPGDKYEKEGWEGIFYWGYCGSIALMIVAYCFKPDTTIQTWALEEARRRLEKEGILEDPDDKKI